MHAASDTALSCAPEPTGAWYAALRPDHALCSGPCVPDLQNAGTDRYCGVGMASARGRRAVAVERATDAQVSRPATAALRILTINTHKGHSAWNRRFMLAELRDAVRSTAADLVFLQEVIGHGSDADADDPSPALP